MNMQCCIRTERKLGKRDPMLYGHFIEHFHRQIYGGVFDPESPFADKDGLRTDVLEAMRKIRVPVLLRGRGLFCRKAPSLALPPEKMSWGRFWGRGRFSERSASPPAPLSRRAAGV